MSEIVIITRDVNRLLIFQLSYNFIVLVFVLNPKINYHY